jgi:LysM repeat protein
MALRQARPRLSPQPMRRKRGCGRTTLRRLTFVQGLHAWSSRYMKMSNPFFPQGSMGAKRQQQTFRARFKFGVAFVLTAHLIFFTGLLIQGCERERTETGTAVRDGTDLPPPDTNRPSVTEQNPETNSAVAPSTAAAATAPTQPSPPGTGAPAAQMITKPYTVVNGDSFYKIAKANRIAVRALADANPGVDSARLKIGQILQVPPGPDAPTAASAPSTALAGTSSRPQTLYVVKSGDTLSSIAKAKGMTVRALKAANGLSGDRVVAGRKLKTPKAKAAVASAPQG